MTYTLLSCIDSKIINPTKFYGRFELGTWNSGQAINIANILRRGLLSELSGTSITFVKIIGTSHEYDTLPGIQECILDILLNLKKIILKSEFKRMLKILSLFVSSFSNRAKISSFFKLSFLI